MGFLADYRNALLFDIEAGSLSPKKSGMLSISYGVEDIRTTHVDPVSGSFLSDWAQKYVVDPAGKVPRIEESSAIKGFIKTLEELPRGSTIAGWNIGYQATPSGHGFDLPFLTERARRYGLEEQLRTSISGLNVRDLGQEFLAASALKLRKAQREFGDRFTDVVDPKMWAQMRPYAEQAAAFQKQGMGIPEIARKMSAGFNPEGRRWMVAGWKQEVAYQTLLGKAQQSAHLSEADVRSLRSIGEALDLPDIEFAERWNRAALPQRLFSQARAAVRRGEEIPWSDIMGRAKSWGLGDVTEQLIKEGAPFFADEGRMITAETMAEKAIRYGRRNRRLLLGAGALAAGLFVFEPLSWFSTDPTAEELRSGTPISAMNPSTLAPMETASFFSGASPDEFNTIEGMSGQGMGSVIRKAMTAFGSGALKKMWKAPKFIRQLFGGAEEFAQMSVKEMEERVTSYRLAEATTVIGAEAKEMAMGMAQPARMLEKKGYGIAGHIAGRIEFDPQRFGTFVEEVTGVAPSMALQKGAFTHEVAEVFYGKEAWKQYLKETKKVTPEGIQTKATELQAKMVGGSHYSKEVLESELFIAAKQGPEALEEMMQFRGAEALAGGNVEYLQQVRGIQEKFQKRFLPMFEKDALDRAGPVAKTLKEKGTDFGGTYQGMAKSLSNAVNFMAKGGVRASQVRAVQVGGQRAMVLGQLGEGAEAIAELAYAPGKGLAVLKSTKQAGPTFAYNPIVSAPGEETYQALRKVAESGERTISREASIMQSAFQEYGNITPEIYGTTSSSILMEYAGKNLENASAATRERAAEWAGEAYRKMLGGSGPVHLDPSLGNIAVKNVGGKEEFRLIDWGVSLRRGELGNIPDKEQVATKIRDFMKMGDDAQKKYSDALYSQHQAQQNMSVITETKGVTQTTQLTPAQIKRQQRRAMMQAQQQKALENAQRQVQEAARSGGKGHTQFASTQSAGSHYMDPFAK
jgi:hypothetical protein